MRRRAGFALVTVLWALVVIGVLAVEFHTTARSDRRVAVNARAIVHARWAARAGLARTLEELDRALGAGGLAQSGDTLLGAVESAENEVDVRGVILDARARLNLNRAARRDGERLLDALGVPAADAPRLADASRAAPLDRVEELRSIPGMSDAAYARLAPHVTVVGDGRVNVNSASMPVLLTIPGIDAEAAAIMVRRRAVAPYRSIFELIASLPTQIQTRLQSRLADVADRVTFSPRVVEIAVVATARDPAVRTELIATVLLGGAQNRSVLRTIER